MYCVQISARIIRWPSACACCCGPANTTVEVSSTRTTGKRVIYRQTKGWEVPYCKRCLAHIRAAQQLRSLSMLVVHLSLVFGLLGGLLALVVFVPLLLYSVPLAIIVGAVILAGMVIVLVITFNWCRQKYDRDVKTKNTERARLEQRLDALLSPSCSEESRLAADYEGWHGSVHTFYFSSQKFITVFERANPGKCLQGGQVHH